jgi:hypothetical protein
MAPDDRLKFKGNVRVVLGVEHHQFRAVDFRPIVRPVC